MFQSSKKIDDAIQPYLDSHDKLNEYFQLIEDDPILFKEYKRLMNERVMYTEFLKNRVKYLESKLKRINN